MGEYGYIIKRHPDSSLQKLSEESRAYYTYTVVNEAKKRGIPAFFWDNDENGIINRKTLEEKHTDLIQAMMDASKWQMPDKSIVYKGGLLLYEW